MEKTNITVLSLGGGVQSTSLALMLDQELLPGFNKPDIAVFADTQWEPKEVYTNLDWLEQQISYPLLRTTHRNLKEDVKRGVTHDDREGFVDIPFFGDTGLMRRQCTLHYKIFPIQRKIKEYLDLPAIKINCTMYLGISKDEAQRMKDSRVQWIKNEYPLIYSGTGITRQGCKQWFERNYPNISLPRSACIGCPYHSAKEWVHIADTEPEGFKEACEIDANLVTVLNQSERQRHSKFQVARLHRRKIPLQEAVEIDRERLELAKQQLTMFEDDLQGNECEGGCFL